MDSTWQTFGHDGVKKLLDRQLGSGKLPHAYLFAGPEGVGKKTLALEFAGKILKTDKPESHPDFRILDEAGQISVESVREFISSLSFKPFFGKYKVAIINNAHALNLQSGNALLKTLEEPSESTIIILIATGRQALPTIVSRCQVLNFNLFPPFQLKTYAAKEGLEADDGVLFASFGSIGRLQRLASRPDFAGRQRELLEKFDRLKKQGLGERLSAIAELAEAEGQDMEELLAIWAFYQKTELKKDTLRNGQVLSAVYEALKQLKTNKNKKLIFQGLFLKI